MGEKIRESVSSREGDGLRTVEPVELTRKRSWMPLSSGEEDKGVDRFKGEDALKIVVDESEDEL